MNLYQYVDSNPVNFHDYYGLSKTECITKGKYEYKKYPGDTMHGGEHWHVYDRKTGKQLGRVSHPDGKVLTGNVSKTALKGLKSLGKIFGAAFGIILELALPAEAVPATRDALSPEEIEGLSITPFDEDRESNISGAGEDSGWTTSSGGWVGL